MLGVPVAHQRPAVGDPPHPFAADQRRLVTTRAQLAAPCLGLGVDDPPREITALDRQQVRLARLRWCHRVAVKDREDFAGIFRRGVVERVEDELISAGRKVAAGPVTLVAFDDHQQAAGFAWIFRLGVLQCCVAPGHTKNAPIPG